VRKEARKLAREKRKKRKADSQQPERAQQRSEGEDEIEIDVEVERGCGRCRLGGSYVVAGRYQLNHSWMGSIWS
jgi:hypothetical protein